MGGISVLVLLGILSSIFYLFLALFVLVIIYLLITYIFESMALFRMRKNQGEKASYLSFLPGYQKYLLGKVARQKILGVVLMIVDVLVIGLCIFFYCSQVFLDWFFLLLLILLCLSFILNTVISHYIFKMSKIKYADIFTIFGVLSLGLLRPIFLFLIRNKKSLMNL